MAVPIAVLDANVLFPASLRDTLLRIASAGLYRLHWSDEILDELRRNLISKRSMEPAKAQRLVDAMMRAFDDANVQGYELLIGTMTNDPNDRHVLAAAVHIGANIIVTSNLSDFPASALAPYEIRAQSPDAFLTDLFDAQPQRVTTIIIEQAAELTNPPKTVQQTLATLAQHLPAFTSLVRRQLEQSNVEASPAPRQNNEDEA